MKLRSTSSTVVAALAGTTAFTAVALLLVTSASSTATRDLGDAIASVRLAEEAEIALLTTSGPDSAAQRARQAAVEEQIARVELYATTDEEREAVHVAKNAVHRVFERGAVTGGEVSEAVEAVEAVVRINVAQAEITQALATRSTRIAMFFGLGAVFVQLVTLAVVLWWLRRAAFRPLIALTEAMERYGTGARDARAVEQGPDELQEAARRFNALADAVEAQRLQLLSFIGGVAHDLGNPLTALRLQVDRVRPDAPLPDEAVLRRLFPLLARNLQRASRMLADLVDRARVEAGRLELTLAPCDLGRIVQDTVSLYVESSTKHAVHVVVPDVPIPLHCDAARIAQVVDNLVSNAMKYSPDGGGVDVVVHRRGDRGLVSVIDHGLGMSKEDQERIFEPFQRATATKTNIPGVGLGLAVVRAIVEAHGGVVSVESEAGRGSTFTVSLPLAAEAPPA